ncbi:phage tail protein [Bosea sp. ANAM02]|uniref:phage tail-collar fiber domain-containing protein n=1 Tax=Bosea sp. ANAM02 TaxID=2020412 RepID=UPI00140EC567|nr:phage tail protein [Bosea sp. ANAM02]BCB18061.1 hypothetical protein OCUBac02_09550 [Bosea sp. ANAM02]
MTTGLLTTTAGRAAIIADLGGGADLVLTQVAWGDANGVPYNPNEAQVALVREKYRAAIASVAVVDGAIVVDATIPADTNDGTGRPSHGFNVAEVGLFSAAGTLIGLARCGNGYKPPPSSGQASAVTYRLKLAVANPSAITVVIDPQAQVNIGRQVRPFWVTVDGVLNDPPAAPATGATYVINGAPTGAWVGQAYKLAQWVGVWVVTAVPTGHQVCDNSVAEDSANRYLKRTAAGWASAIATETAVGPAKIASEAEVTTGDLSRTVSAYSLARRLRGAASTASIPAGGWDEAGETWGIHPCLLLGTEAGGPGGAYYFHCWTIRYNAVGTLTQVAIPYSEAATSTYGWLMRIRTGGAWGAWRPLIRDGSETQTGVLALASAAEAVAGLNTTKAITAAGLQKARLKKTRVVISTPGAFSWTVPAGITTVQLIGWGDGGGGGFGNNPSGPAGGGGGAQFEWTVDVVPGNTITGTIGGGGAAGFAGNNGASGAGTTVTANGQTRTAGGGAGGVNAGGGAVTNSALGGAVSGGAVDVSRNGSPSAGGLQGYSGSGTLFYAGKGGVAPNGGVGGNAGTGAGNGGVIPGGGGGGGASGNVAGAGARGELWILY